jgi:hypothetical protein
VETKIATFPRNWLKKRCLPGAKTCSGPKIDHFGRGGGGGEAIKFWIKLQGVKYSGFTRANITGFIPEILVFISEFSGTFPQEFLWT